MNRNARKMQAQDAQRPGPPAWDDDDEGRIRTGPPWMFIILTLAALAATGWLWYTDRLGPSVERARRETVALYHKALVLLGKEAPVESPSGAPAPVIEEEVQLEEVAEEAPSSKGKGAVSTAPARAPSASEATKVRSAQTPERVEIRADPDAARYRAQYRAPKIGAPLTLVLKSGSQMQGVLQAYDATSVTVNRGNTSVTIPRANLAPVSAARFDQEQYVQFNLDLQRRKVAAEEARLAAQEEEDARAEEESERAASAPKRSAADLGRRTTEKSHSTSSARAKKRTRPVDVQNLDMKTEMEKNGASEALEARQRRMKEYEEKARATGSGAQL